MTTGSTGSYHSSNTSRQHSLKLVNIGLHNDGVSGWLMVALTLVGAGGVAYAMQSPWAGLIALAVLWTTIWRMFVPVQFEFSPLGVTEHVFRRKRRISWRSVRAIKVYKDGVLIADHSDRSLSKTYVRFAGKRQALLSVLASYADVREQEPTPEAESEG